MATTAQWFSARAAAGFAAKIKQVLMEHIQKLSYTELDTIGTSTLITRMTSDGTCRAPLPYLQRTHNPHGACSR